MDDTGLLFSGMREAISALQSGRISATELASYFLGRIGSLDARIGCMITVTEELALQQAGKADQLLVEARKAKNQSSLSPLLGIPITLKDLYQTRGIPTTAGARFWRQNIPDQDAAVVERLYAEGVVLLGKTNMHEIALGLTTVNPHYGICRNPWAMECIAGGSSGGSAAALAAGCCLGSMGSDTGGSIRVPAALCGIVGLKPTFGRISLRGVLPLSFSLDHAGPMGRQVWDVALLLQMTAGYDPEDPFSANRPVGDYLSGLSHGIQGWRVAVAEDDYMQKTGPEVLGLVNQAAGVFESLGAQVDRVPFPDLFTAALNNSLMVVSEAAALYALRFRSQPEVFGEDIQQRLTHGSKVLVEDYISARRQQAVLRRKFENFFTQYDLLLTPTTPVPAPPVEGTGALEHARLLTRYTAPFNFTGLPALSVPCGFTSLGLPVGLQLVSKAWNEAALLQAGFAYEQAAGWFERQPVL